MKNIFRMQKGQSLIEILIAVTVGVILIGGVAGLIIVLTRSGSDAKKAENVYPIAKELLDRVKSVTQSDWHKVYGLNKGATSTYFVQYSTSTQEWNFSAGTESVNHDGKTYTRFFYVENVNRDKCGVGDVSSNSTTICVNPGSVGVADDPSTQKITAVVTSPSGEETKIDAYISRSKNVVFYQNDWSEGSNQLYFATTTDNTLINAKFASSTSLNNGIVGELKLTYDDYVQSTTTDNRIAIGSNTGCAVRADGALYCWGSNPGNGGNLALSPVQTNDETGTGFLTDVYYISVGSDGSNLTSSCAVKTNGALYCWGDTPNGEFGDGSYKMSGAGTEVPPDGGGPYVNQTYRPKPVPGMNNIKQVSAGGNFICAVSDAGNVYCWGRNTEGQLGIGHALDRACIGWDNDCFPYPQQVGIANVKKVDVGTEHVCALKTDGSIWCWGGQWTAAGVKYLTNAIPNGTPTPVKINSLGNDNKDITVGDSHACVIKNNSTVWCWGNVNNQFQINYDPIQVKMSADGPALDEIISISAGGQVSRNAHYTCAVKVSGELYCWGNNGDGQLGTGDYNSQNYPVHVKNSNGNGNLGDVSIVSIGSYHSMGYVTTCAGTKDGQVYCWGRNENGSLGIGTTNTPARTNLPILVFGVSGGGNLTDVKSIHLGSNTTCAVRFNGVLYCWGRNEYGELGLGYQGASYERSPAQVRAPSGPPNYLENVTNADSYGWNTCAIINDFGINKTYCWGRNDQQQVLLGSGITSFNLPVRVASRSGTYLNDVTQLSVGSSFACAIKNDGTVWCWGSSSNNKLGGGSWDPNWVQVSGVSNARQIAVGISNACVVVANGNVYCWGYQLAGIQQVNIANVATSNGALSMQSQHACAVKTDQTAWCWTVDAVWSDVDNNDRGQLGDGSGDGTNRATPRVKLQPVQVVGGDAGGSFLTGVSHITAGGKHSCAVKTDGSAYCWGHNYFGQLGLGTASGPVGGWATPIYYSVPKRVRGVGGSGNLANVSAIAAGSSHTCAIQDATEDYKALCWGMGEVLGDGTNVARMYPKYVFDAKQDFSLNINLYHPQGILESSVFDTLIDGGVAINSVTWQGQRPSGTKVGFQIAVSNNSNGPWNYYGPGGTSNMDDFFTTEPGVSTPLNPNLFNNKRYFKYRLFLFPDGGRISSPTVDKVLINYSP